MTFRVWDEQWNEITGDERKCRHGYGMKQGPCPTCDAPRSDDQEVCGVEWDDRDDPAIPRGWGYSCQLNWEHDGLHRCDDFEWVK